MFSIVDYLDFMSFVVEVNWIYFIDIKLDLRFQVKLRFFQLFLYDTNIYYWKLIYIYIVSYFFFRKLYWSNFWNTYPDLLESSLFLRPINLLFFSRFIIRIIISRLLTFDFLPHVLAKYKHSIMSPLIFPLKLKAQFIAFKSFLCPAITPLLTTLFTQRALFIDWSK